MSALKIHSFDKIVQEIGSAGVQMTQLGAAEGSAGNISLFVREFDRLGADFHLRGEIPLPVCTPALAGGWLFVSGTGRRLRDLATQPQTSLCLLHIHTDGTQASLYAGIDLRPTSEVNSHLAIHDDQIARRRLDSHAIVHAQPIHLTFLSHLQAYTDNRSLNRRLMRWEPETILVFPEGIGMLPYQLPGSARLMSATLEGMRAHRAIVWQRHGIVTRSDKGVQHAADLVEYAETAAHYEYLNLQLGEPSQGLTREQLREICATTGISPTFFD